MTLDEMNRFLTAFMAQDYHKVLHSEIKNTPEKAYENGLRVTRQMDLNDFCASTHFNMNTHPFAENPPIDWLLTEKPT